MEEKINIELSKEDYDFLIKTKNELETQDNRCTRDPFYIIKAIKKVYGFAEDYSSDFELYNAENETTFQINEIDEMIEYLEEYEIEFDKDSFINDEYEREEILEKNGFERVYYNEVEYIVEEGTYFLTEQAALAHLGKNKHRLPSSAFTYADSSWRNQQINKLRDIILKIKNIMSTETQKLATLSFVTDTDVSYYKLGDVESSFLDMEFLQISSKNYGDDGVGLSSKELDEII